MYSTQNIKFNYISKSYTKTLDTCIPIIFPKLYDKSTKHKQSCYKCTYKPEEWIPIGLVNCINLLTSEDELTRFLKMFYYRRWMSILLVIHVKKNNTKCRPSSTG